MGFCPVCGAVGQPIGPRCERIAAYYGYSSENLRHLSQAESSIAVPFFDIKRFFFVLESLAQHPLARAMLKAVEHAEFGGAEEFGNSVRVVPFADIGFPQCSEIYVKDDVSKTMVVYEHEDSIEHVGLEERAVLFAEVAHGFFGLSECVPAAVCGLTPKGTKFVASAGLPKTQFASLHERPRDDLQASWDSGVLPRLALMDFILGQNDRNAQNVLFTAGANPRVGLIDNDDAFVKHERLVAPFAYLVALGPDVGNLNFGVVRKWFETFRLPKLAALLLPLALPEETLMAVCRRFVFAEQAVFDAMSLADFMKAVFVERPPLTWALESCPWVICRTLVSEGQGATQYRTIIGQQRGVAHELFVLEGKLLNLETAPTSLTVGSFYGQAESQNAAQSLVAAAMNEGFVHVLRRRFFVATRSDDALVDAVRIVEVRSDLSGFHVLVKKGGLGRYGKRQTEKFLSFETSAQALAHADEMEATLLSTNFIDLRGRLESFKAPPLPVIF